MCLEGRTTPSAPPAPTYAPFPTSYALLSTSYAPPPLLPTPCALYISFPSQHGNGGALLNYRVSKKIKHLQAHNLWSLTQGKKTMNEFYSVVVAVGIGLSFHL